MNATVRHESPVPAVPKISPETIKTLAADMNRTGFGTAISKAF